jgi:hypothetical protein
MNASREGPKVKRFAGLILLLFCAAMACPAFAEASGGWA